MASVTATNHGYFDFDEYVPLSSFNVTYAEPRGQQSARLLALCGVAPAALTDSYFLFQ